MKYLFLILSVFLLLSSCQSPEQKRLVEYQLQQFEKAKQDSIAESAKRDRSIFINEGATVEEITMYDNATEEGKDSLRHILEDRYVAEIEKRAKESETEKKEKK